MLPVTDVSIAQVQLPALQDAIRQDSGSSSDEEGRGHGGPGGRLCDVEVVLFRAGGSCWAALCQSPLASAVSSAAAANSNTGRGSPRTDPRTDALTLALEVAARDGLVAPVSKEAFEKGPSAAAQEAFLGPWAGSANGLGGGPGISRGGGSSSAAVGPAVSELASASLSPAEPGSDCAIGSEGAATFRPFRFPTKMSDAFRLPWTEIGVVSDDQLRSFYEGTQMRSTPKRVIGAVGFLRQCYLNPFKQKIISKGRHLLVIKIVETSGRRPQKRCLAWWMPLAEVRERYADPKKAEMYHEGGSVHRVCQLVETYKLCATVPIHFEIGERPHVTVGGFPLHCFDLDVDFHTRWSLGSDPAALLEERREVERCLATHSVLEMSSEARKAEKRRRKRQNKKAREHERAAEEAQTQPDGGSDNEAQELDSGVVAGSGSLLDHPTVPFNGMAARAGEEGRRGLVQPNQALLDSSFLSGLLDQMRQRKVALAAEKTGEAAAVVAQ